MSAHTTAFPLAAGVVPLGDQLVQEILTATGIDVSKAYGYTGTDIIIATSVVGNQEATIRTIVAAHKPV